MTTRPVTAATPAPRTQPLGFDPLDALDTLLADVGLSGGQRRGTGHLCRTGSILPAAHRLRRIIGIPLMASAIAAVGLHRHRSGPRRICILTFAKRSTPSTRAPSGARR